MGRKPRQSFTIEHALLGLLRQQPMHGYEIYQRVKTHEILGMIWQVKQSQVYALLTKLEQAGYLASTTETQQAYPPRKVLHLTDAGAHAFANWITTPVQQWEDIQPDFLARLFFAQLAGDESALTLVEGQRTVSAAWLEELTHQLETLKPCQASEWLVKQFQKNQLEALLDWLSRCTVHFREPLYVVHTIAPVRNSAYPALAQRFVDYVCSPAGQALLEDYRFIPVNRERPSEAAAAQAARSSEPSVSPDDTLTVFAAATFNEAFHALAQTFSDIHSGITIHLYFAGSQHLADQLIAGEAADVFAAANPQQMAPVIQAGRVAAGSERAFARNRLIAVTSRSQPRHLVTLRDLAQPGIKIALGSQATAIGHYTHDMLTRATQGGYLQSAEHDAVLDNVAFYEQDVRDVLSKVLRGEADVGIVYTSDYYGVEEAAESSLVHPLDELWLNTT
jgi:molybdenum ABC transporter molybdate-binding protein